MFGEFITTLEWNEAWLWLVVAAVLFATEMMVPGFFLVWLGFAATIVGVTLFFVPLSHQWQILEFCAASGLSVGAGWLFWGAGKTGDTDKPLLNLRGQQLVGQTFEVAEPIRLGRGRVQVGDSLWNARGPDLPAGAKVRVTGIDGTDLLVEAVDGG
jgi:membrane protein implicated in regulation of membrane protease activity